MYLDDIYNYSSNCFFIITSAVENNDAIKWHARLGYIGIERMNRLARERLLSPLNKLELPKCEHCLAGKIT